MLNDIYIYQEDIMRYIIDRGTWTRKQTHMVLYLENKIIKNLWTSIFNHNPNRRST